MFLNKSFEKVNFDNNKSKIKMYDFSTDFLVFAKPEYVRL